MQPTSLGVTSTAGAASPLAPAAPALTLAADTRSVRWAQLPKGETLQKSVLGMGLLLLVGANILWAVILGRPAPLVGAVVYAVVAFQVLRRDEYRAAFFVGVAGAALHLFEFFRNGGASALLHTCLVTVNVVLPVLVALVGLTAWRRQVRSAARDAGA